MSHEGLLLREWSAALRPHQWAKNLLIFLPLLMAHEWSEVSAWIAAVEGFLCFCLCASAVYLFNDVMDREADRAHPRKKMRPIARGAIDPRRAIVVGICLMVSSLAASAAVSSRFFLSLALYCVITFLYSAWLKRIFLVDCVVLTALYTARIVAGSAATGVEISPWLFTFSAFVFFSLASVKRYAELVLARRAGITTLRGRGYGIENLRRVSVLGVSSGVIAVITLGAYVRSETAKVLYPSAGWLGVGLLPVAAWLGWIWWRSAVGTMGDDPVLFALKDRTSVALAATIFVTFVLAALG